MIATQPERINLELAPDRPLKNAEAEKVAQAIALVMDDRNARQRMFAEFVERQTELKHWEACAVAARAQTIARLRLLKA